MPFQVDISDLPAEVKRELVDGEHFRRVQDMEDAYRRQAELAAATPGFARSMDGLGRLRIQLDPTVFHYWGQRLGYECWHDPQFLAEFERDNPQVRIRCHGTKPMVGWTPTVRKFVKHYADERP